MKLEDIIWDIKTILGATKAELRNSVEDRFLANKINNYRSVFIATFFDQNFIINDNWTQDLGVKKVAKVNSADDPSIVISSISVGKLQLPGIIPLIDISGYNRGYYRISTTSRQKTIFQTSTERLFNMIYCKDPRLKLFYFYFTIQDSIYIYPYLNQVIPVVILDDPMNGIIKKTDYVLSGQMIPGEMYTVVRGSIIYGSLGTQKKGDVFTCTEQIGINFTGSGFVMKANQLTNMTVQSNYPVDRKMAQQIILEILTKEFQIEMGHVQDVVEDNQDQFKIIKSV